MLNELVTKRLREIRESKNMSRAVLAEKSGIDETYLGRIERNEINTTVQTLDKIIKSLDITYDDFFSMFTLDDEWSEIISKVESSDKKEYIMQAIQILLQIDD
ncbi:helix-turn-helix domain-containing protein [Enterococcus sp. DIV0187]|uniref:helix-turn-helix domain-containing protein n=1 Tax=Enterococcus sp. DIV0187 TaxID=2774644 RepID=UPI003F2158AC